MTGKPKELSKSARDGVKRATGKVVYRIHDLIENGDIVEFGGANYRYIGRVREDGMCAIQSIDTRGIFRHPYDLLKLIRKNQA